MPKYELDWDAIDKDREKLQGANALNTDTQPKDGNASNYLKMVEPGVQKLRILPMGNFITKKPYKQITRHELKTFNGTTEGFAFILCWDYISKERKDIGKPLADAQKLTPEDAAKYRQYGCPICQARIALYRAKEKGAASKLGQREKWLWNVIARTDGEKRTAGMVYVYSTSKTIGESIYDQLQTYRENEINVLDLRHGYDFQITATGPNNQDRKYSSPMFLAVPRPAVKSDPTGEGIEPHDLTEYAMRDFKGYQETIDLLLLAMGRVLERIGYKIPGDESSWDAGEQIPDVPHSEMREVFAAQMPRERKIKREDYNSADEYFDDAVPPDEPEVELRPVRRPASKGARVEEPVKTSKKIRVGDRDVRLQRKGKVTRILEEDDDEIPF